MWRLQFIFRKRWQCFWTKINQWNNMIEKGLLVFCEKDLFWVFLGTILWTLMLFQLCFHMQLLPLAQGSQKLAFILFLSEWVLIPSIKSSIASGHMTVAANNWQDFYHMILMYIVTINSTMWRVWRDLVCRMHKRLIKFNELHYAIESKVRDCCHLVKGIKQIETHLRIADGVNRRKINGKINLGMHWRCW